MTQVLRVICDEATVGRLAIDHRGQPIFQYEQSWLETGFDLSPHTLPFVATANRAMRPTFDGLHGVFNDSLPDGWGLLLMDRAFKQIKGVEHTAITPLDRLAYMGHRCMGALEYKPELLPERESGPIDLALIAAQSEAVLAGDTVSVLEALRICGGSPGGARPKVTVAFSDDMKQCLSGFSTLPTGFTHWIVKFRNGGQYENSDPVGIGTEEYAYAEMARQAGLIMPKTALVEVKTSKGLEKFFAVQRFDRVENTKIHFLSLAGYIYANHREPCLDYQDGVLSAVRKLTASSQEVEKAFRLMVFNILAHNRDDHSKNFAFLRNPSRGAWELAPAFDLTFNQGMRGYHTTSIAGEALKPSIEHIKAVAERHRIKNWLEILEHVRSAISMWPSIANEFGVEKARAKEIFSALKSVDV